MSIDAFNVAWTRPDIHFEYRMFYLESILDLTDSLGKTSILARNCYLSYKEYNAYM